VTRLLARVRGSAALRVRADLTRLGNALLVAGLAALALAGAWQLGLVPGSRVTLPAPVALERRPPTPAAAPPVAPPAVAPPVTTARRDAAPVPAPPAVPAPPGGDARADDGARPPDTMPTANDPPIAAAAAGPAFPAGYRAPDSDDRAADAALPVPGHAVRLAIPSIALDTPVEQAGIVPGPDGQPEWETRPFVAVHYGDLTALVGARGNAVIAGHVVTRFEGNVFRMLYKVDLGDAIQVWDERDHLHAFRVVDVRLVSPTDTSVMAPTTDRTLTLITCGGTFDPLARRFSDRLVVVAKPAE
jgi:LPXTG-site transpeptidase (sortase) family protein